MPPKGLEEEPSGLTTNLNITSLDLIRIFREAKEELLSGYGANVGDLQMLDMLIKKVIDQANQWNNETRWKLPPDIKP